MDTIKPIFRQLDIDSVDAMSPNERSVVATETDERFVFEKVSPARLSVTRRVSSNADGRHAGDGRTESEIVFRIEGGAWIPIEYTRPPAVHRFDATGLTSVPGFDDCSDTHRKPESI